MPLPIVGNKQLREATHPVLDVSRLMDIAGQVDEMMADMGESELTPELVQDLADDIGTRESFVYAAVAAFSDLACDASDELRVSMCVGNCQRFGALELLDKVLAVNGKRRFEGKPNFGVTALSCMDRCDDGPIVRFHTPDGVAGMTLVSMDDLEEQLGLLLSE
jgi:NADH:ubiquinone oxidoreductase subunit E